MNSRQKLERIVETIVERKLNESSGVDVFMVKKTRYGLNDPVTYQVFTDNRSSPNATCEVSIEKVKQFELELFGGLNNAAVRLFDKYK